MIILFLGKEILLIRFREIILRPALAAKGLAVPDLLQVVQAAGNPLVPVAVESVEIDARPAVLVLCQEIVQIKHALFRPLSC